MYTGLHTCIQAYTCVYQPTYSRVVRPTPVYTVHLCRPAYICVYLPVYQPTSGYTGLHRSDARRRPRRRVATGLERMLRVVTMLLRRQRQSRPGAAGRRPQGPTLASGAAPALLGAAPARTFADALPTRTPKPHLAAAAPTRRGAAVHLPAPRGPTTRTAASADRQGPAGPSRSGARRGVSRVRPGRAGQLADYPLLTA